MKGNPELLNALNGLLADELTVINQYIVHAEMAEHWGYERLEDRIQSRSIAEMKHSKKLIARILFLEGVPIVSNLNGIHIGADVPKQFDNDLAAELSAVSAYNAAITLATEVGDNATKELLESILKDEDGHVDEIEAQKDQVDQMGLQLYLSTQVG